MRLSKEGESKREKVEERWKEGKRGQEERIDRVWRERVRIDGWRQKAGCIFF